MRENISLWKKQPLERGTKWVIGGNMPYKVIKCTKILWWYRMILEPTVFEHGEF